MINAGGENGLVRRNRALWLFVVGALFLGLRGFAFANDYTFYLHGDASTYYPVFFYDDVWDRGVFDINIHRANVHTDGQWQGSMVARFWVHETDWGNGSDYLNYDIHVNGGSNNVPHIADAQLCSIAQGFVVWLRGSATYYYTCDHQVSQILENSSGDGSITVTQSPNPIESYAVKTAVDPNFRITGTTVSSGLTVQGGDLKVQGGGFDVENNGAHFTYDGAAAVSLSYPARGSGGRAMVADAGNMLAINYAGDFSGGTKIGPNILFSNSGNSYIDSGNVGIGTTTPTHKLEVNGTIRAKEVIVEANNWPDYVFAKGAPQPSLAAWQQSIQRNGHLPGIPSAADVKKQDGVGVGEMQKAMLKKIEQLSLIVIQQEKRIDELEAKSKAREVKKRDKLK